MLRILILCTLFFISAELFGQKMLGVTNYKRFKREVYRSGDYIRFRTQGSKAVFLGKVEEVSDSTLSILKEIVISDENGTQRSTYRDQVALKDISIVYKRPKNRSTVHLINSASAAFLAAGLWNGFVRGIEAWQAHKAGDKYKPQRFIQPAVFLGIGGLLKALNRSKYRIGNRWQLTPMEATVLK